MTATLSTNGQVRKNLASQLDRLDGILDGLSDGLNDAVVAAVKEAVGLAVQEAVRAVLTEVLTHPELLDPLRGRVVASAPAPVAAPASVPAAAAPFGARLTRRLGPGAKEDLMSARIQPTARPCGGSPAASTRRSRPSWPPTRVAEEKLTPRRRSPLSRGARTRAIGHLRGDAGNGCLRWQRLLPGRAGTRNLRVGALKVRESVLHGAV
jgi:hypothetical protein